MRSEVLMGFWEIAVLQLVRKGVFPMAEYSLHHIVGLEDTLLRYRVHMGICTFFYFYGTFALFWDRKNMIGGTFGTVEGDTLTGEESDVLHGALGVPGALSIVLCLLVWQSLERS
jgi:hypothetical protein